MFGVLWPLSLCNACVVLVKRAHIKMLLECYSSGLLGWGGGVVCVCGGGAGVEEGGAVSKEASSPHI